MSTAMLFDDSLPTFAALVDREWGKAALSTNLFLRDVSGKLTLVVLDERVTDQRAKALAFNVESELGCYVDNGGLSVSTPLELFDESLTDIRLALQIHITHPIFSGSVNLIDRRMVGADWLRNPKPNAAPPTRFVFASLKGGVGRSTALCVLASHVASRGSRVLAIDMDLEAPGLGNLLLPDNTLPEFGLLDYLVESEAGNTLDDPFFADVVAPSWLGGGRGRVDVVPAIGKRSLRNPANVLAKLARAYLMGYSPEGKSLTFSDHISALVDRLADPLRYDLILVDARAGLHETTAAAVLGLGAEVFFFGTDQPQTFAGYELLFAHLSTLPAGQEDDDWRSRIHIVQAKAPTGGKKRASFNERMLALKAKYFDNAQPALEPLVDSSSLTNTFAVEWSEIGSSAVDALLNTDSTDTLAVFDDKRFVDFDPLTDPALLASPVYSASYGQFLATIEKAVATLTEKEGEPI